MCSRGRYQFSVHWVLQGALLRFPFHALEDRQTHQAVVCHPLPVLGMWCEDEIFTGVRGHMLQQLKKKLGHAPAKHLGIVPVTASPLCWLPWEWVGMGEDAVRVASTRKMK